VGAQAPVHPGGREGEIVKVWTKPRDGVRRGVKAEGRAEALTYRRRAARANHQ